MTMTNLLGLVKRISSGSDIKVCVSSRPWNVFTDAFGKSPSLRLEDLSRRDIELFIRGNFGQSQGFRELRESFPCEADQLIDNIAVKAEGVFLWVTLVSKSLLHGLAEGDKLKGPPKTIWRVAYRFRRAIPKDTRHR